MLETDAPFLSPQQMHGKCNEPSYLPFIVTDISEIKKMTFEEVTKQTTINAKNFFKIG